MEHVRKLIRDVPDFPKQGIIFKDITPVLACPRALRTTIDGLAGLFADKKIDKVAATESRGFIFGVCLATRLEAGFVPIRKPGKLPYQTQRVSYSLEYGEGHLEVHADAFGAGENVLFIDDLLATGGTALGSCQLIERQGARVAGLGFFIELGFLNGRHLLGEREVRSLVQL